MPLSDLDAEFVRNTYEFIKKNAISPQDYRGESAAMAGLYNKSFASTKTDDLLTIERRASQIGYTKLEAVTAGRDRSRKNAYLMFFDRKEKLKGDPSGYIPMWFLPWAENRMTTMTIPPKMPLRPGQAPERNRATDPDIFFTAAINGCSVLVHGDPKTPTISHGGTPDPRSNWKADLPDNVSHFAQGSARQHWEGLHGKFFSGASGYGTKQGISAADYINTMGTKTTPEALEYQKFLQSKGDKTLQMSQVNAEGCCFGLRDPGGNWSFYLQKNILLTITRMKKKHGFFGSMVPVMRGVSNLNKGAPSATNRTIEGFDMSRATKVTEKIDMIEDSVSISIPINVVKFFPGGKGENRAHGMMDKNEVKAICVAAMG